jgi:2'-5' RNA ligase
VKDPASRGGPFQPPLSYRITGRLNVVVWRLPLPHRVLARISMLVYRNPPMPGTLVVEAVEALRAAGVSCWVSGGWGVDALAGLRSRVHRDLDLMVDREHCEPASEALAELGYAEWYRVDSDRPTFSRVVVRDHPLAGHVIDLHPIETSAGQLEFDTGSIEGRQVPCLAVESQVKTHSNYRKRWRDRADLGTLQKAVEGSSTALIVPVQAASELLEDTAREAGMPAHVTLLHPFLRSRRIGSETERELSDLIAGFPAFDFALSEARNFPKVLYLAPEPATPFVAMVQAVVARWPEQQPYGGAFEEIVPHLTLGYRDDVPADLAARLPVRARAQEVWLMSRVGQRWSIRRRFELAE